MSGQFCFCAKLETGGIVLGILGIVANTCLIIGSIVAVAVLSAQKQTPEDETLLTFVTIIAVFVIIFSIFYLIASIYLYVGTKQRRPGYVRVWLVASMISIVLSCLQLLKGFASPDFTIIIQMISLSISIYWYSCISELREVFVRERASQQTMYQPHDVAKSESA